jgi:ribosomal protein S18 acetylase RimI-like enzyme
MPVVIERSWVGRRVSIRRAVGAQFSDVVGDLTELTDDRAILDTRRGTVDLALSDVAIAKLVPASTAEELALEAVAAKGWRAAETAWLDGWLLRANSGLTSRANSVLPLKQLRRPLTDALDYCRDWYSQRGLPLMIATPTESRRLLDAELGERGWDFGNDAHVMVRKLTQHPAPTHPIVLTAAPSDGWLQCCRADAATDPAFRGLVIRHDDAIFAEIAIDGRVVATGRGAVDLDDRGTTWLGLSGIEVDPAHRRQGLARAIVDALHGWGVERRATRSYLQVLQTNTPAIELYKGLGYYVHHDYRYRTSP